MSFSKRERGEYIRNQMMDIAIVGIDKKTIDKDWFAEVYDLISCVDVAGNPKGNKELNITPKEVATHPAYIEALNRWRKALEAREERLNSRSL